MPAVEEDHIIIQSRDQFTASAKTIFIILWILADRSRVLDSHLKNHNSTEEGLGSCWYCVESSRDFLSLFSLYIKTHSDRVSDCCLKIFILTCPICSGAGFLSPCNRNKIFGSSVLCSRCPLSPPPRGGPPPPPPPPPKKKKGESEETQGSSSRRRSLGSSVVYLIVSGITTI